MSYRIGNDDSEQDRLYIQAEIYTDQQLVGLNGVGAVCEFGCGSVAIH